MFWIDGKALSDALKIFKQSLGRALFGGCIQYHIIDGRIGLTAVSQDLKLFIMLNLACTSDHNRDGLIGVKELEAFLKGATGQMLLSPHLLSFLELVAKKRLEPYGKEFPEFPASKCDEVRLGSGFLKGLALCLPYTSSPKLRPLYSCIFCLNENMYATDTWHIIRCAYGSGITSTIMSQTAKALFLATRLYKTESISAVANEVENQFRTENFSIYAPAGNHQAPSFEKVIPRSGGSYYDNAITFETPRLIEAVKSFPSKYTDGWNDEILKIRENSRDAQGCEIQISSYGRDLSTSVHAEAKGEPVHAALSRDKLLHLAQSFSDEKYITLYHGGSEREVVVSQGDNILSMVLPTICGGEKGSFEGERKPDVA